MKWKSSINIDIWTAALMLILIFIEWYWVLHYHYTIPDTVVVKKERKLLYGYSYQLQQYTWYIHGRESRGHSRREGIGGRGGGRWKALPAWPSTSQSGASERPVPLHDPRHVRRRTPQGRIAVLVWGGRDCWYWEEREGKHFVRGGSDSVVQRVYRYCCMALVACTSNIQKCRRVRQTHDNKQPLYYYYRALYSYCCISSNI